MTLRDGLGEVEVRFGDLFEYQGATLAVVCPEPDTLHLAMPIICVRLKSGAVEKNGQRFEIGVDGHQPLFDFTAELVASCIRAYRVKHGEPVPQNVAEASRARTSKKDIGQHQPKPQSLF